jgi:hypothetical protein
MKSKIGISFFIIFIFCSLTIAQTDKEKEAARKAYKEGAVHFANGVKDTNLKNKEKKLEAARKKLHESLKLWKHPTTAYFLSIVYVEQKNVSKAKEYAELALEPESQLEQEYVDSAKEVIEWANRYIIKKRKRPPTSSPVGMKVSLVSTKITPLSGYVVPSSEL